MMDLYVFIKGRYSPEENYLEVYVVYPDHSTVRKARFDLERGKSALARQMNRNRWHQAQDAIESFKLEFENGIWNDPKYYNQVV